MKSFKSLCFSDCATFLLICDVLLFVMSVKTFAEDINIKSRITVSPAPLDSDLGAPFEVIVDSTTSTSISLSWRPPTSIKDSSLKLFTYILSLSPLSYHPAEEREFSLPPTITKKLITGLSEGTRYVVLLSAVYGDPEQVANRAKLRQVSAPKFTVQLPSALQQDNPPVGGNGLPFGEPACNCSEAGMLACTRRPGFVECACQPGYAGKWCEKCASGNFRNGKECTLCPCSNLTSTAECIIGSSGQVSCMECLPGHRGSMCSSCTAGYHWTEDRCTPLNCLSNSLCAEQRDAPGCEDCVFLVDHFPSPAHRSNSDRSIADGTLPLIAVVVTLGILLLVAAMATCYRYWNYRRHQPRIPFWSIELQDDKSDLQTHCQYQHLDAATNRGVNDTQQEGVSGQLPCREAGRLTTESNPRSYNTMNI